MKALFWKMRKIIHKKFAQLSSNSNFRVRKDVWRNIELFKKRPTRSILGHCTSCYSSSICLDIWQYQKQLVDYIQNKLDKIDHLQIFISFVAMRYCVQFENHAIEIALIRVNVMRKKVQGQFPWRDFQTERKNITFKTLKI